MDGRGNAVGVAVGGDGDGADVVGVDEGGGNVLRDGVRVLAGRNVAVVNVPPDRNLGLTVWRGVWLRLHGHPSTRTALNFSSPLPSFLFTVTTYFITLPLFFFFSFFF